jgi:hypothetical protein
VAVFEQAEPQYPAQNPVVATDFGTSNDGASQSDKSAYKLSQQWEYWNSTGWYENDNGKSKRHYIFPFPTHN